MKKPKSIAAIMNEARESGSHLKDLRNSFRSRLAAFTKDREKESQHELEADFNKVLERWGIACPENLEGVIFCLRARLLILAVLPLTYGIIALCLRTFNSLLVFAMLAIPCLFGLLATAWRIRVLKNTRFVPFTRWLMRGCGLWL